MESTLCGHTITKHIRASSLSRLKILNKQTFRPFFTSWNKQNTYTELLLERLTRADAGAGGKFSPECVEWPSLDPSSGGTT